MQKEKIGTAEIAIEQVHIIFAWKCMPSVNTVPKENIRLCDVTEATPTSF